MNEKKLNTSIKKCSICNNKKIGEFTIINDKKYHLCCIEQLQQENKRLIYQQYKLGNHIKELNNVLARMPLDKTLMQCEIDTYKSRIDKAIEEIKKELEENHHLSYGVALSVINMLDGYKFLDGDK